MNNIEIVMGSENDINGLSYLLNHYRIFYNQAPNKEACFSFLEERFNKNDSVIFYARNITDDLNSAEPVGFVQLYPSFSTVSLKRLWILNDLYVDKKFRRKGVAKSLLLKAEDYARQTGAKGLSLETAHDNYNAQKLYESLGWLKDEESFHYQLIF